MRKSDFFRSSGIDLLRIEKRPDILCIGGVFFFYVLQRGQGLCSALAASGFSALGRQRSASQQVPDCAMMTRRVFGTSQSVSDGWNRPSSRIMNGQTILPSALRRASSAFHSERDDSLSSFLMRSPLIVKLLFEPEKNRPRGRLIALFCGSGLCAFFGSLVLSIFLRKKAVKFSGRKTFRSNFLLFVPCLIGLFCCQKISLPRHNQWIFFEPKNPLRTG